jgi:hypothetical protein
MLSTQDIILLSALAGTLVTTLSVVWKLSRDMSKSQTELRSSIEQLLKEEVGSVRAQVAKVVEDAAKSQERLYTRIDDGDRRTATEFVRCGMCNVLHGMLKEATKDIADDVKRLLERAGIGND